MNHFHNHHLPDKILVISLSYFDIRVHKTMFISLVGKFPFRSISWMSVTSKSSGLSGSYQQSWHLKIWARIMFGFIGISSINTDWKQWIVLPSGCFDIVRLRTCSLASMIGLFMITWIMLSFSLIYLTSSLCWTDLIGGPVVKSAK